jgi:hypothetical protein
MSLESGVTLILRKNSTIDEVVGWLEKEIKMLSAATVKANITSTLLPPLINMGAWTFGGHDCCLS